MSFGLQSDTNLSLVHEQFTSQGIFGSLYHNGALLAHTCEHAYQNADGTWVPKLGPGSYTCVRGPHNLGLGSFDTFEITGVTGHTGILFHTGNTEDDSHGCVLLGETQGLLNGVPAVISSAKAFQAFMNLLDSVDTFQLEVK